MTKGTVHMSSSAVDVAALLVSDGSLTKRVWARQATCAGM